MSNHTPGPWKVEGGEIQFGSIGECVVDYVYTKADAHLIAAAPDMLEALENLENDDGHQNKTAWRLVQAAIAKAKGETNV
jgi:hypothetical protein